jgi:hypothetical protein
MLTIDKPIEPENDEAKWIERTKVRFFKMVQQQINKLKH